MYKQFDKNGDGKITVDDVEILLKEMGLGQVSPCAYSHHFLTVVIDDVLFRSRQGRLYSGRSKP